MKVFIKALGKVALLVLPFGLGLCGCGKTKCATCAAAEKLFFKMCGGKKYFKTEAFACLLEAVCPICFLSSLKLIKSRSVQS